jgi:hypothetical protein
VRNIVFLKSYSGIDAREQDEKFSRKVLIDFAELFKLKGLQNRNAS